MQSRGEFGLLFHLGVFSHLHPVKESWQTAGADSTDVESVGMNRHSNRHASTREAQVAFKILMTH